MSEKFKCPMCELDCDSADHLDRHLCKKENIHVEEEDDFLTGDTNDMSEVFDGEF